MSEKKIVQAHNDVHKLVELAHYENHDGRTESAEFRATKKRFHEMGAKCWINNKHCQGNLEIHHSLIEYSANTEVDWEKVKADHPEVTDVDCFEQMMPLCALHHRGKFHGIHSMTYPIWILQKYMTDEALDRFEQAIKEEMEKEKNE